VRAHGDVLAAALRPHADARLDLFLAMFERRRGDDQMIEHRTNH
jgi:hypothetical protein